MPRASAPDHPIELPDAVRARAPHAAAVWRNELGGVTFRDRDRFFKWNPVSTGITLQPEVERGRWLAQHHPVPQVVEFSADGSGELLVTRALPGDGAVTARWLADPRRAVRAIAEGLRVLHERVPAGQCPFDWSVATRTAELEPEVCATLGAAPAHDRLVVCHGDPCAPNTIIGPDGAWVAHVDLGELGVADRWADLAVASMNLDVNYGPGWQPEFFAAYGIRPDAERIAFYRALWNAG